MIPMRFNVPIGALIRGIVLLVAADFDLLEAPGGKASAVCSQVALVVEVFEAEASGQAVDVLKLVLLAADEVVDHFNHPVVV